MWSGSTGFRPTRFLVIWRMDCSLSFCCSAVVFWLIVFVVIGIGGFDAIAAYVWFSSCRSGLSSDMLSAIFVAYSLLRLSSIEYILSILLFVVDSFLLVMFIWLLKSFISSAVSSVVSL